MTIYCVIARDPESGDEWVMPKTFETIMEAAEYAETCRIEDPTARYRLENVKPTPPLDYKELLAKFLSMPPSIYVDTDSLRAEKIRTEDFTVGELFPDGSYIHNMNYGAYMCTECAALVGDVEGHVKWHNKLLP